MIVWVLAWHLSIASGKTNENKSIRSVPFHLRTYARVILIDVVQTFSGNAVGSFFMLSQLMFIAIIWYAMACIDDLNEHIRKFDKKTNATELKQSFIEVINFHNDILR